MSEKNIKNEKLLGKKKKKLDLDTFLKETNNKKKKISESESETYNKDKKQKKDDSSNSSDSDTEVFKINPEKMKNQPKREINKFTGKEYTEEYYKLLEKRKSLPVWSSKKTILDLVEKKSYCDYSR